MRHPLVNRTSLKGAPFVGTCAACGMTGLTSATMQGECENVRGMTNEQALLEAIEPPGMRPDPDVPPEGRAEATLTGRDTPT
jgi:hypothetical protein